MNRFNEEKFIPEKIRSGVNIPVKIIDVNLKAGESISIMQPVYYNSTSKVFTTVSEGGELYGYSAVSEVVDSENISTTKIAIYASGEFYKDAVVLVNKEDIDSLIIQSRKLGIFLE